MTVSRLFRPAVATLVAAAALVVAAPVAQAYPSNTPCGQLEREAKQARSNATIFFLLDDARSGGAWIGKAVAKERAAATCWKVFYRR